MAFWRQVAPAKRADVQRGDVIASIDGLTSEGLSLERAVELDPAFASAHSALSAIYGSLGETRERASHARNSPRVHLEVLTGDGACERPEAFRREQLRR